MSPPDARSGTLAALMLCLCIAVRPAGVVPLHAAAMSVGDRGVLIPACSGSGKSTLSISLAMSGWAYLSDDALLLHRAQGVVMATPFRRTLAILPETMEAFSQLRGDWSTMTSDSRKSLVNLHDVSSIETSESSVAAALVFPILTGDASSSIRPIRPSEAVLKLLAQSALLHIRPDWTRDHINLLKDLVSQAPAFELAAGVDLLEDHSLAASLIEDKLNEPYACTAA